MTHNLSEQLAKDDKMTFRIVLLVLFALIFSGCATLQPTYYHVNVDSIVDKAFDGRSFYIISGMRDVNTEDLRFKRYSAYVGAVMEKAGYQEVDDPSKSEFILILSYGVGNKEVEVSTRSIPVYGGNGFTSTVQNQYGQQVGTISTQPANPYLPSGYNTVTDTEVTFQRTIKIVAVNSKLAMQKKPELKQVWDASIVSRGSSDDLQKLFPVMLVAWHPYIGKNLMKRESVEIYESDRRIEYLNAVVEARTRGRKPSNN